MKKTRKIALGLALGMGLLTGCGSADKKDLEYYKTEVDSLEKELETAREKISFYEETYGIIEVEDSDQATEGEASREKKVENIELGQLVSIEDYGEFTIEDAKFTQRIDPSNPDSYYSYYEVKDPKNIFLNLIVKFKNNSTIGLKGSEVIDSKVIYDGKYTYTSFSVAEESGGGDMETFSNIDPLSERRIHSIIEMPLEVRDSDKSVVANISVYGKTYSLKIK